MKMLLCVLAILISSCSQVRAQEETSPKPEDKIVYIKDHRTNLCFATTWGGTWHGGPAMATVPCSSEVEKLLQFAPHLNSSENQPGSWW